MRKWTRNRERERSRGVRGSWMEEGITQLHVGLMLGFISLRGSGFGAFEGDGVALLPTVGGKIEYESLMWAISAPLGPGPRLLTLRRLLTIVAPPSFRFAFPSFSTFTFSSFVFIYLSSTLFFFSFYIHSDASTHLPFLSLHFRYIIYDFYFCFLLASVFFFFF